MHGTTVTFGERALLLGDAPARLPATVLLPAGQIRPGRSAPPPRPTDATWTDPLHRQGTPPTGEVLIPGTQDTVRARAEHATSPAAQRRRTAAAQALGLQITAQDDVDVPVADSLTPPASDELRYAAAMLDLGAWRYKVDHCAPGARLAALLEQRPDDLEPGPGQGAVIGADFDGIPGGAEPTEDSWPTAVLASITARHRLIAHLQARQYADIARLSASYTGIHQFLTTELALALHSTDADAAALLGAAEALRDRLPDTQQALLAGEIDDAKAMAILRATMSTTDEVARTVEQKVLPEAGAVTASTLRRRAGRAVIAADPDGAADRHRQARSDRHVHRMPDGDGMARLGVYAPAQDIATIWEAITAVADAIRMPGDERSLGQRRADALVMMCSDVLSAGGWNGLRLPDKGLDRPRVSVTVPYTALLGHRAPCELAGHGAITTEQALSLVGAGDLYRMICDPVTGQMLDYGRTRYKPPPHLAEFVRMRDGECPMPSCHQSATRGDLDHVVPAKPDPVTGKPTLGTTSANNLAPPCRHHHLSKDAGRGFSVHRATDGTYTWTTPLGLHYTWRPEPHWHPDTDATGGSNGEVGPGGDAVDRRGSNGAAAHVPVCDCLDTCPCQHGPAPDAPDVFAPVVLEGDWADGFATPADADGAGTQTDSAKPGGMKSCTMDLGSSISDRARPDGSISDRARPGGTTSDRAHPDSSIPDRPHSADAMLHSANPERVIRDGADTQVGNAHPDGVNPDAVPPGDEPPPF